MTVGGFELEKFGTITISRSVNGVGLNGLVTSELSFTAPGDFYAERAAKVVAYVPSKTATFYISNRSKSGNTTTVRCLDRMAFADADFPANQLDAYNDDVKLKARIKSLDEKLVTKEITIVDYNTQLETAKIQYSGEATVGAISDILKSAIGELTGVSGIPSDLNTIPISKLKGVKCSDVLQMLSDIGVGVWVIDDSDRLSFIPFGAADGYTVIDKHTAIDEGDRYDVEGLELIGNGVVYKQGSPSHKYNTVIINSDLATQKMCDNIWNGRLSGHSQQAVSVSNCLVSFVLPAVCDVAFAQRPNTTYRINSATYTITRAGIYAQLAGNAPAGDEIGTRGYITREVDTKVTANKKSGHVVHTPYQGDIMVD